MGKDTNYRTIIGPCMDRNSPALALFGASEGGARARITLTAAFMIHYSDTIIYK